MPPDAAPAQAPTHTSTPHCGTTLRRPAPHAPARTTPTPARAASSGTRPTHDAHPRRHAPLPRTHAALQAPAAHPRRTRAPRTQERSEHTRPGVHALSPRKQLEAFLHTAAARARLRQQDRGQCTWHGIGRLSRRRHGDRMSGRGAPCGALFFVLSHFTRQCCCDWFCKLVGVFPCSFDRYRMQFRVGGTRPAARCVCQC